METEDVNSSLILQVCLWFENLFYMIIASCHCQLFIWLYTVNRSAFILHWGCNNNSYYLVICWFHSSAQPTVRELFIPIKLGVFSFKHNTLKQTPKQLKGKELQGYKVTRFPHDSEDVKFTVSCVAHSQSIIWILCTVSMQMTCCPQGMNPTLTLDYTHGCLSFITYIRCYSTGA